MMTPAYTSGVGAKEIVQAHGMTVGELARFFDGEFLEADEGARLGDALEVVQVSGWSRDTVFADTGLTWVLPSPNMPTPDTALVYPGTCLFEGTNLSEGRGTTRPFELVGAPFVDHRWAERLVARDVPGVTFREAYFNPVVNKFVGQVCGGVQVHVTDPRRLDGPRLGAEMLVAAKALYPDFAWRKDSWDAQRPYWVDKLTGSTRLREMVDAGASADEVVGAWRAELAAFERRAGPTSSTAGVAGDPPPGPRAARHERARRLRGDGRRARRGQRLRPTREGVHARRTPSCATPPRAPPASTPHPSRRPSGSSTPTRRPPRAATRCTAARSASWATTARSWPGTPAAGRCAGRTRPPSCRASSGSRCGTTPSSTSPR